MDPYLLDHIYEFSDYETKCDAWQYIPDFKAKTRELMKERLIKELYWKIQSPPVMRAFPVSLLHGNRITMQISRTAGSVTIKYHIHHIHNIHYITSKYIIRMWNTCTACTTKSKNISMLWVKKIDD